MTESTMAEPDSLESVSLSWSSSSSIQFSPFCHMARFPARLMTPLSLSLSLSVCSSFCLTVSFLSSPSLSFSLRPSGVALFLSRIFSQSLPLLLLVLCLHWIIYLLFVFEGYYVCTPQGQQGDWKILGDKDTTYQITPPQHRNVINRGVKTQQYLYSSPPTTLWTHHYCITTL